MTTATTLNFQQQLIVMEALDEMAAHVRDRVAAGDTTMQDTLTEIETVQALIETGTIQTTTTRTPKEAA
ncbi:hypothetical protein [Actinomyces succiniciruminis]|uniref:Uncharacterized protein n=1 Tax=Actinomyces succiniciruminis TaxID=1522002 RepID=A0A1L7RS64_9ACTO|nr:hypothetical protein [Actinomyces succiniciruminis]CED92438.1 Hypothetical protein AAM4_2606 [Actinomyces succiniciruminis]